MTGGRLTQQESQRIAAGLAGKLSSAEIAGRIVRPTSTINRDIARNGGTGTPTHGRSARRNEGTRERGNEGRGDHRAVRDSGRTAAEVTRRVKVSPPSVSVAVSRSSMGIAIRSGVAATTPGTTGS
ncbi:helix-turn-helix domain-containing protein [Streptomyces erythrochromogenes]|uniref:helix-turn-helix domain-containing protein n=1 Tax=Streptomyces erythrochromogenes TaxID=285574 RepID=UPI00381267DD